VNPTQKQFSLNRAASKAKQFPISDTEKKVLSKIKHFSRILEIIHRPCNRTGAFSSLEGGRNNKGSAKTNYDQEKHTELISQRKVDKP